MSRFASLALAGFLAVVGDDRAIASGVGSADEDMSGAPLRAQSEECDWKEALPDQEAEEACPEDEEPPRQGAPPRRDSALEDLLAPADPMPYRDDKRPVQKKAR